MNMYESVMKQFDGLETMEGLGSATLGIVWDQQILWRRLPNAKGDKFVLLLLFMLHLNLVSLLVCAQLFYSVSRNYGPDDLPN